MKKYLLPLISLLIAISCRGEVNDTFVEGHLVYKIISEIDHEVAVNDVDTPIIGDFSIPSEVIYEGVTYIVRTIGKYAFSNESSITSLIIPDSVTKIEERPFEGCIDMHSVVIGKGLKTIQSDAFLRCDNLKEVIFNAQACNILDSAHRTSSQTFLPSNVETLGFGENVEIIPSYICSGLKKITSINIPNSAITIGNWAFASCSSIKTLVIGNSVKSIGKNAFNGCIGIASLNIPNSITDIADYAFNNCKGLNSVCIGEGVKNVDYGAFLGCENLKKVIFNPENCNDGLTFPSSVETVLFGDKVKNIPSNIFAGCKNITSITIPNSVISIGYEAFRNCTGLETIAIPDSVTTIGVQAFLECSGLKSVYLGKSIENIQWGAFRDCESINSINIPESVILIERYAFAGCKNLKDVIFEAKNCDYNGGLEPETGIIWEYPLFPSCVENITFGEKVKRVPEHMFCGSQLSSLKLPNSVTTIGKKAFYGCSGLESLEIPNSVTTIGDKVFYDCTGLITVIIGNSINSFGKDVFGHCYALIKSAYPKTIEQDPFLSGVSIAYNPEGTIIENGWIYGKDKSSILYAPYTLSGEYIVPDNFTSIEKLAFAKCEDLASIVISNSVTHIGDEAFSGCTGLLSVKIGRGLTALNSNVFSLCNNIRNVNFEAENCKNNSGAALFLPSLETIQFGENVRTIPAYLCKDCDKIPSVIIPNSVTSIEEYAFAGCSGLDKLTMSSSINTIGVSAFDGCSGIKTLELPNSLTTIGDRALYGCSGLETLEIPNSVTTIGTEAFYNCSGLKSVLIGNSVQMIGRDAFNQCTSLLKSAYPKTIVSSPFNRGISVAYDPEVSIIEDGWIWNSDKSKILFAPYNFSGEYTIPDNVTAIGESAFAGCEELTSITIPDSVTDVENEAFTGCSGLNFVEIGRGLQSLNSNTFKGCVNIKEVSFEAVNCQNSSNNSYSGIFPSSLETIKFGDKVKSIPAYLCKGCANLTSITLPGSVQSIGEEAFSLCSGLESLEMGNAVNSIGYAAFELCTQLSSVQLSNSLTRIGSCAFEDCYNLKEIILPPSVSKIGSNAFNACLSLEKIIMGNVSTINGGAFANVKPGRIFVTAPMPPALGMYAFLWEEDVEWYEDLLLCVQDEAAKEAYMASKYDWNLISDISTMIVPTVFKMKETTISGEPGDQVLLNATLEPEDVTLPYIFWRSTNPEVATVDHNGLVTIHNNSSDVMFFEGGNDPQECKIIAETLYPNVPIIEIPVISETTTGMMDIDIEDSVDSDPTPENSCIVYSLNGLRVAYSTDNLQPGIYIVRKGKKVNKIIVK